MKSGDRVFVHGACATPTPLLDALVARADLEDVQLYHLHLNGPCAFTGAACKGIFSNSLFTGPSLRGPVEQGLAEFIPVFLSDIPALFTSGQVPLDVAFLQLSPPDAHGMCTLGTSVDAAQAAVCAAGTILAEINERMPRTHGHTAVPFSRVKAFVHTDRPLHAAQHAAPGGVEARIGELIAALVEDGATLQMGIGAIPDAVLARLGDKHELGVHTEMFSDGLIPLLEGGVVTNREKRVHPGRTVASFVSGSERLFDFVHDNLLVELHPCDRTNDTALIRKNPKVCAINAALEIDLTGQVCADSMGHKIYRSAFHGRRRKDLPHRHHAETGGRRGHDPRARSLCGDGVRRGESARTDPAKASRSAHFHRASGLPCRAAARRERAPSLHTRVHLNGRTDYHVIVAHCPAPRMMRRPWLPHPSLWNRHRPQSRSSNHFSARSSDSISIQPSRSSPRTSSIKTCRSRPTAERKQR